MKKVGSHIPLSQVVARLGSHRDAQNRVTGQGLAAAVKAARADGSLDGMDKAALGLAWERMAGGGYWATPAAQTRWAALQQKGEVLPTTEVVGAMTAEAAVEGKFKPTGGLAAVQKAFARAEKAQSAGGGSITRAELGDVLAAASKDGTIDDSERAMIALEMSGHRSTAAAQQELHAQVRDGKLTAPQEIRDLVQANAVLELE